MKALLLRSCILVAALVLPLHAFAVYVYNTVDYPGAVFTDVRGINNTGRIVGYASLDAVNNFGFSYAGGVFAPLPALAFGTVAHGINDSGVIVGSTQEPAERGLIFDGTSYTFFTRPGWTHTEARAISNAGYVTGFSFNTDAAGVFIDTSGFIYDPVTNTFTDIYFPGSSLTIAQGMNAAGQVVGSANLPPLGARAFLRETGGATTLFQIGGVRTRARGINDTGLIAGFVDIPTVPPGARGFVGNSSGFQYLDVPGADTTVAEAINNAGQVAGLWTVGAVTHGFIATPAAMPTGTTSAGAYTFSVDVVANVPIFIDPPVAVGYDYAIGKGNPRIATLRLPIGIGDSLYSLKVEGRKFPLAGGVLFDFRDHGFKKGVTGFTVGCIETSAMLDPANPQAFPTELSFVASGRFTGTQKPLVRDSSKPVKGGCKPGKDDDDDGNGDDHEGQD